MKLRTIIQLERMKRFATAKELADAAGVTVMRYKRFERGLKYYHLTPDELERVAKVLNISIESFADAKGAPILGEWCEA